MMVNLIENGSFETGAFADDTARWTRSLDDDGRIRIADDLGRRGGRCAEFRWRSEPGRPCWLEQEIAAGGLPAGGFLSFWVRAPEGVGVLAVEVANAWGDDLREELALSDEWSRRSIRLASIGAARRVRFEALSSAPMHLDDVSLAPWLGLVAYEPYPWPRLEPPPDWRPLPPLAPLPPLQRSGALEGRIADIDRRLDSLERAVARIAAALGDSGEANQRGSKAPSDG
jgi:hypothetical protein